MALLTFLLKSTILSQLTDLLSWVLICWVLICLSLVLNLTWRVCQLNKDPAQNYRNVGIERQTATHYLISPSPSVVCVFCVQLCQHACMLRRFKPSNMASTHGCCLCPLLSGPASLSVTTTHTADKGDNTQHTLFL